MTALRALAFGDLPTQTWGVAWLPEVGAPAQLAAGRGSETELLPSRLEPAEPDQPWRLDGDGVSLSFAPTGPPGHGGLADGELASLDQLCTVSGTLHLAGTEAELQCLGLCSLVEVKGGLGAIDSFRWLVGWFAPQQGFSLTALRPGKARGHDADLVAATVIADPAPPRVDDPRFSTTYGESELPVRAGLELWLEAADEAESEDETPHRYPRRAAGEAVLSGLAWEETGFELHASLLRWHSHGQSGPGVYLLGQRP